MERINNTTPITQFISTIPTLQNQLNKMMEEMENYLKFMKDEKFTKKENESKEEWRNKKCLEVLFDTERNGYPKDNTTIFEDKVKGKGNLIFVIEDTNNNKFGGYVNSTIDKIDSFIRDANSYLQFMDLVSVVEKVSEFCYSEQIKCYSIFMLYKTFSSLNNTFFRKNSFVFSKPYKISKIFLIQTLKKIKNLKQN